MIIHFYKDKTENQKRNLLSIVYGLIFVVFIFYKALLPLDKVYMEIYRDHYGYFSYLNELPFNPCNIALILIQLSLWTKKRPLFTACFMISTFGPLLAILMPSVGFSGYGLISIHMLGYYITHFAILMIPVLLFGLGIYRPEYSDTPRFAITFIIMTFCVFLIDLFLHKSGLCDIANYFYCMNNDGNPVLVLLWNLIPIPFVYLLPCALLIIPVGALITFVYKSVGKLTSK